MLTSLYLKSVKIELPSFNSKVILLQPVEVSQDGSISRISQFKPFDIADSLLQFRSSDFSISSLSAVGALDKLKTTYMANMSSTNVADSFENLKFVDDVPQ